MSKYLQPAKTNFPKQTRTSVIFYLLSLLLFCTTTIVKAQNTTYTPLYTSYNFTKTIDVTKPVGFVQGSGAGSGSGGGHIPCQFILRQVLHL